MILEFKWWYALSQRINDNQLSAYILNDHFLVFYSFSNGLVLNINVLRIPLLLFLAIKTTVELSPKILKGLEIVSTIFSPKMKLLSHTPCDVASKQETNLASMVEVAVKVCLTLLHEIAPPAIMKMYLDVDLREST